MAGSINLSLSQQFDKLNGNLLSGGRLYFYAAGTDAPQDAFKDTGLVLPHPNPIILASDGRVPQLYFADGSIHVRLTDSGGVVQFDEDNILVVGPSSGGGGGGGGGTSVDPNAIFTTGWIDWQPVDEERSGWVRCNGNTIGNSGSGATYHAAECQALFEYLWNKYPDSICSASGGRGGLSAADAWSGNTKTLKLLDFREMTIGGLATMGGPGDRGIFANIPHERGDQNTPAGIVGEIVHLLSHIDVPTHSHTGANSGSTEVNSVDHTHSFSFPASEGGNATGATPTGGSIWFGSGSATTGGENIAHTHLFTTTPFGDGNPHNVTSRTMLGTFYQRL
jgi:hypothetical protein